MSSQLLKENLFTEANELYEVIENELQKQESSESQSTDKNSVGENKFLKINGVVLGKLISLESNGSILINFPFNPECNPVIAPSAYSFRQDDIGIEIAIIFQNENVYYPFVIGPVLRDKHEQEPGSNSAEITVDKKKIIFNAENEISLKCGKASITLTKAGKILIRGKYLLSRSSGVNKIKGSSVQIN